MKAQSKQTVEKIAFSIEEVSERTGLSKGHLRNEHKRGKLRFVKSGRRTLIMLDELRRYFDEQADSKVGSREEARDAG